MPLVGHWHTVNPKGHILPYPFLFRETLAHKTSMQVVSLFFLSVTIYGNSSSRSWHTGTFQTQWLKFVFSIFIYSSFITFCENPGEAASWSHRGTLNVSVAHMDNGSFWSSCINSFHIKGCSSIFFVIPGYSPSVNRTTGITVNATEYEHQPISICPLFPSPLYCQFSEASAYSTKYNVLLIIIYFNQYINKGKTKFTSIETE